MAVLMMFMVVIAIGPVDMFRGGRRFDGRHGWLRLQREGAIVVRLPRGGWKLDPGVTASFQGGGT